MFCDHVHVTLAVDSFSHSTGRGSAGFFVGNVVFSGAKFTTMVNGLACFTNCFYLLHSVNVEEFYVMHHMKLLLLNVNPTNYTKIYNAQIVTHYKRLIKTVFAEGSHRLQTE